MIYLSNSFKMPAISYTEALIVIQKLWHTVELIGITLCVRNKLVEVTENRGHKIKTNYRICFVI